MFFSEYEGAYYSITFTMLHTVLRNISQPNSEIGENVPELPISFKTKATRTLTSFFKSSTSTTLIKLNLFVPIKFS